MVTMQEIAAAAQVSRPTVSLVLNGKSSKVRISEETRSRVIAVAKELGYQPNALARAVRSGKTTVIAFICRLPSGYVMEIVAGLSQVLLREGYTLKLFKVAGNSGPDAYREAALNCIQERVGGVVCHHCSHKLHTLVHAELARHMIPMILVDSQESISGCGRIASDDFAGAQLAVEHLVELGHRRIACLTTESQEHDYSVIRHDGYLAGMAAAGGSCGHDNTLRLSGNFELSPEHFTRISQFLVERKPTAVFCTTDPLAMKVLQVAYRLGLRIPDQLSVVGFAGLDYSLISSPPLTTIAQPFEEMGAVAAKALLTAIRNRTSIAAIDRHLPVSLIARESTAPPSRSPS